MQPGSLRPLGVAEILDAAFKIYFRRFVPMAIAVTIAVLPLLVVSGLIQISAAPDFLEQIGTNPFEQSRVDPTFEVDGSQLGLFFAGNIVAVLLAVIAGSMATAATLQLTAGAYLGTHPDWKASLRFAMRNLLPVIGLSFIAGIGMLFGLVLCVFPGILLWVLWSVAMPAMLLDDDETRGVFSSLSRSRELVKGRFWETLAIQLLAFLIALAVGSMFGGAVLVVPFLSSSYTVLLIFQTLLGIISAIITTPFSAAVTSVLYFDLRVRREGYDLELLANSMQVDSSQGFPVGDLPPTSPMPTRPGAGPPPPPPGPPTSPPPPSPPAPPEGWNR